MRNFTALIAAATLAFTALAPAAADARDRGRGWGHDRHYDNHYRHHDHDDGDALAAGAVGLVLGLALGSIASQPRQERYYDQRGDYGPPSGYYNDRRYDDRRSAYEQDYGAYYEEPPIRARCMRAERVWDRYAGRYVIIDVPC